MRLWTGKLVKAHYIIAERPPAMNSVILVSFPGSPGSSIDIALNKYCAGVETDADLQVPADWYRAVPDSN